MLRALIVIEPLIQVISYRAMNTNKKSNHDIVLHKLPAYVRNNTWLKRLNSSDIQIGDGTLTLQSREEVIRVTNKLGGRFHK